MTSSPDTSGILVCAGNATRMQGQNKILLPLGQTNVIGMSMLAMEHCDRIAEFIVVARPSDHDAIQKTIADLQLKKLPRKNARRSGYSFVSREFMRP